MEGEAEVGWEASAEGWAGPEDLQADREIARDNTKRLRGWCSFMRIEYRVLVSRSHGLGLDVLPSFGEIRLRPVGLRAWHRG